MWIAHNIAEKMSKEWKSDHSTLLALGTVIAVYFSRQAIGATVAVYNPVIDETWMFMKEISSDGDVSTVGVTWF